VSQTPQGILYLQIRRQIPGLRNRQNERSTFEFLQLVTDQKKVYCRFKFKQVAASLRQFLPVKEGYFFNPYQGKGGKNKTAN